MRPDVRAGPEGSELFAGRGAASTATSRGSRVEGLLRRLLAKPHGFEGSGRSGAACGAQARSATSLLGLMPGRFRDHPAALRTAACSTTPMVDRPCRTGVRSLLDQGFSGLARHVLRRGGSPCAIPTASPVLPRVPRSWGCSPRSSASLCSQAESQRPPSRSLSRSSSTLGPSTDRSASAASPGRALHVGAIPACVPTPTNGQYDQAVVANTVAPPGDPPGFGSQSLRMSNACASGEFFYQTYSPQELQQVGEARPNKVFIAEFAFMSKTPAHQPGLFLSVSPDSGEGSRMSWVGLEDTAERYSGQRQRHPRGRWRVRRAPWPAA